VYRAQSEDPEDLEDVWPNYTNRGSTTLTRSEFNRSTTPTAATWWPSARWSVWGQSAPWRPSRTKPRPGAAIAGISGLTIGLAELTGPWCRCRRRLTSYADARRQLFFPDEDDLTAVSAVSIARTRTSE
jgi:hypothetical protein